MKNIILALLFLPLSGAFAQSSSLYTVACTLSYDKVMSADDLARHPYKTDAFVWTIDLGQKKYYSWASNELLPIAKITDSEICFQYEQDKSVGISSECINRFDGKYSDSYGILGIQRLGLCKKVEFRSFPASRF